MRRLLPTLLVDLLPGVTVEPRQCGTSDRHTTRRLTRAQWREWQEHGEITCAARGCRGLMHTPAHLTRLRDDARREGAPVNHIPMDELLTWAVEDVRPTSGLGRIQRETGAPEATGTPATATDCEGVEKPMTSIPGVREDVSIVGTGITHVPMVGRPAFDGLLLGADGSAVARIQDGALSIEVSDLDMAIAWRAAWQDAVSHLITHREQGKREARS